MALHTNTVTRDTAGAYYAACRLSPVAHHSIARHRRIVHVSKCCTLLPLALCNTVNRPGHAYVTPDHHHFVFDRRVALRAETTVHRPVFNAVRPSGEDLQRLERIVMSKD